MPRSFEVLGALERHELHLPVLFPRRLRIGQNAPVELPPFRHDELPNPNVQRLDVDDRPVTGPMARYLGRQYLVADFLGTASSTMLDFSVFDDECTPSPELLRSLARVRAFAVPALEGRNVSALDDGAFVAALEWVLRQDVPGVAWSVDLNPSALRKHLFFETTLAAPLDETTGMPMALQLFGNVIALDDVAWGTREWDRVVDAWRIDALARVEAERPPAPLAVPFTVRIEVATYANVQSCGVGVPFYC